MYRLKFVVEHGIPFYKIERKVSLLLFSFYVQVDNSFALTRDYAEFLLKAIEVKEAKISSFFLSYLIVNREAIDKQYYEYIRNRSRSSSSSN